MEDIVIDHEHVVGADYSGLSLGQFSAQGCTFEGCKFDRIRVGQASFGAGREQSLYVGCSFDRASLPFLGGYVRFVNCTFRQAMFIRCSSDFLEFVDCTFAGRITGLELRGVPHRAQTIYEAGVKGFARRGEPEPPGYRQLVLRDRNQIRGNDFSGAELIRVNFRFGVDLAAQKLPTGDDYLYLPDAQTALRRAVAALEQDSSPLAGEARTFLEDILQREIDFGQRQLLLRPKDFERRKVVPPRVLLAAELLRRFR